VNLPRHATVWRFEDAPEPYRALSQHGGDEDWIIVVPSAKHELGVDLAEELMVCDYSEQNLGEEIVFITAHA
jgi:hypothetical protein